jgi:hypothetical protein
MKFTLTTTPLDLIAKFDCVLLCKIHMFILTNLYILLKTEYFKNKTGNGTLRCSTTIYRVLSNCTGFM